MAVRTQTRTLSTTRQEVYILGAEDKNSWLNFRSGTHHGKSRALAACELIYPGAIPVPSNCGIFSFKCSPDALVVSKSLLHLRKANLDKLGRVEDEPK